MAKRERTALLSVFLAWLALSPRGRTTSLSFCAEVTEQAALPEELVPSAPLAEEAYKPKELDVFARQAILKALERPGPTIAAVDPSYIIGPRDTIVINLWGAKTQTFAPVVDENGFVSFVMTDPAGSFEIRFPVNGIPFRDLKERVTRELAKFTNAIDPAHPESSAILVDVTLGEIRGINIAVLGEVNEPAQRAMKTTITTVLNALAAAGGITPKGSLRELQIRHPDGGAANLDLYDLLLTDKATSPTASAVFSYLRDGDALIVPPVRRSATLSGQVKRPATYELKSGETLAHLVEIAGGLEPSADSEKISILRTKDTPEARYLSVSLLKEPDLGLLDGDQIQVNPKPKTRRLNTVEIKGEGVRQPGVYEFREGMTILDLIKLAGGLHEDALADSAAFVRTNKDFSLSFSTVNLVSILNDPETQDFQLSPLDKLIVYSKFYQQGGEKFVTIEGHVKEPGRVPLSAQMTLYDLIFMTGGFGDKDLLKETYLERGDIVRQEAGGPVNISFHLDRLLQNDPAENYLLQSEDAVKIYSVAEIEGEKKLRIEGHVKRPSTYQLKKDMRLSDLLFLSGGFEDEDFLKETYLERGDIIRKEFGLETTMPFNLGTLLQGDQAENHLLQREDTIRIYSLKDVEGEKTVSISGHVKQPGAYPLQSGMRVSDLLFLGGGFQDADFLAHTYLDRADIVRLDPITREAKIIAVNIRKILAGDTGENAALQRMDRLHVYSSREFSDTVTVTIEGEVRSPGEYALIGNMILADLISLANGLTDKADPDRIEIARFPEPGKSDAASAQRAVLSIREAGAFPLQPGDKVVVRRKAELRDKGSVTVTGEVAYPGAYVLLSHTETLSDVIARAGGFVQGAAPDAARLVRKEAGPVSIDLVKALKEKRGPYDLVLLDGDEIAIPKENWMVEVKGQVLFPRAAQFVKGASVSDYLERVGGTTKQAKRSATVIIYPNGAVRKAWRGFWPFRFSRKVKPGSVILAPDRFGYQALGEEEKEQELIPEAPATQPTSKETTIPQEKLEWQGREQTSANEAAPMPTLKAQAEAQAQPAVQGAPMAATELETQTLGRAKEQSPPNDLTRAPQATAHAERPAQAPAEARPQGPIRLPLPEPQGSQDNRAAAETTGAANAAQ